LVPKGKSVGAETKYAPIEWLIHMIIGIKTGKLILAKRIKRA